MHCGFRRAVVWTAHDGHKRKAGSGEDQRGWNGLGLQEGQEMRDEVDVREIIRGELGADAFQVYALWFGEVNLALDT